MKRLIEREPITPFTDRVRGLAERGVSTILVIVSSDDNPDYKIPWLLFVLILPIAGFMLYFIFYSRKLQKRFIRRLNAMKDRGYKKDDGALFEMMREEDPTAFSQAKMLCSISGRPSVHRYEADLFSARRKYARRHAGGSRQSRKIHLS